jgi:hypothetical protein
VAVKRRAAILVVLAAAAVWILPAGNIPAFRAGKCPS